MFNSIECLRNQTIINIKKGDNELIFLLENALKIKLYHMQNCCEDVYIEDICGDLQDLLDTPILVATEESGNIQEVGKSGTWTFYKLDTIKGGITIRCVGYSNGYYSESVDFLFG